MAPWQTISMVQNTSRSWSRGFFLILSTTAASGIDVHLLCTNLACINLPPDPLYLLVNRLSWVGRAFFFPCCHILIVFPGDARSGSDGLCSCNQYSWRERDRGGGGSHAYRGFPAYQTCTVTTYLHRLRTPFG